MLRRNMISSNNFYYWLSGGLAIFAVIGIVLFNHFNTEQPDAPIINPDTPPPEFSTVKNIIDAITIQLETGHIVRYLGVRAPEVQAQVECFGPEALKANESVIGKEIRLEEDPVLLRAQDGAWVRYVYLQEEDTEENRENEPEEENNSDNEESTDTETSSEEESDEENSANEIFINEKILEGGFAFPLISEEMEHGERMLSAARFASATGKGMWSRCEISEQAGRLKTEIQEDCIIKGRITNQGEKIYRTPDCPGYKQTIVIESQGDEWFCAEDIAEDAGFSKGSDCP